MSLIKHLHPICKGAGTGFVVGLASVAIVDKKLMFIFGLVNAPVTLLMWLSEKVLGLSNGSAALLGWFCTVVYWMLIGGLIGWGFGIVRARTYGEE